MDALITIIIGAVIVTIVTIAGGGAFLLRTAGNPDRTPIQAAFFRAGHAHAGVLVMLGLLCIVLQRTSDVAGLWQWAPMGVLTAAILMPLGFFTAVWPRGTTRPNRWIAFLWLGAAVLVLGLLAVAASLIVAGFAAL